MECWLNRCGWVSLVPSGDLLVQARQHFILRELSEDSHLFRERVAVVRDDSLFGKYRAGKRRSGLDRPSGILEAGANRHYKRETVALVPAWHCRHRDRRSL